MYEHSHFTVYWHREELTSRIVAESGIPSDRFHMGKIIHRSLKDDPDFILQIDGGTGESETKRSVLKRSIQCAMSMKEMGIQVGDEVALMAPNHIDLVIPFYACLFIGAKIVPVDRFLLVNELVDSFKKSTPKMIFCQNEKVADIEEALKICDLKANVISFDKSETVLTFKDFLKKSDDEKAIENYKPADFDPAETIAILIPTSGTTGLPKYAAASHKSFAVMSPIFLSKAVQIPPFKSSLITSPIQWLSALLNILSSSCFKFTMIQSSRPITIEHGHELINKYRPELIITSPTLMATLIRPDERHKCDFTCFKHIMLGGNTVLPQFIEEMTSLVPKATVNISYGLSELTNMAFMHAFSTPLTSVGKPLGCLLYRLVDENGDDVMQEPHKRGELWLYGPALFKGYYRNPEATKEVFSEDGWLKTGDLFYRDESWNFYFVERIKLLLKYKNHQISPSEVEMVIRQHPGVLEVVVTGIPDLESGELPVACVVPRPGHAPTAQEIKDLVKDSLTDTKQLRGGVVFFDKLPTTASTKIHRRKLNEMIVNMKRE